MTVELYASPGISPTTAESYVSPDWDIQVNGAPGTVLSWTRDVPFGIDNWWDEGDITVMSWIKFGLTGEAVTLTITPRDELLAEIGALTTSVVHMYPPRSFAIVDGDIVIDGVTENTKLIIIVGDYSHGEASGTRHPLMIQCSAPRSAPGGTVVVYNGSQTVAETGKTLHFTGPAVYEIGLITMEEDSSVEIDGDVIVVGQFCGEQTGPFSSVNGWTIGGHGAISGEWARWEDVILLPTFEEQFAHVTINSQTVNSIDNLPHDTTVEGVTIFAPPYHAIGNASNNEGVMIIAPWHPNSDGIHLGAGRSGNEAVANNCLIWTSDDSITLGEAYGSHIVTNNLIASSNSAVFHLGYHPAAEFDTDVTRITNNDVMSAQTWYDIGDGKRGGYVVVGWCDGEISEQDHVIKGYVFDGLRVWADPSGEIRSTPIELENHGYPWGGDSFPAADEVGRISEIEFHDVWFEVTPANRSRIAGRDSQSTPSGILFRNLTIGGVRVGVRNAEAYFEIGDSVFNARFDGASVA